MRNGIPEFRPRQPLDRQLSSTTLNDIRRELESLRITRVVNGTFRKLPGGTEIVVAPQSGGSTPTTRQPWDLIARADTNRYFIRVEPGTLAGFLATNWDEDFEAQVGALYYAKAVVQTDGTAIISVAIAIDTNEPQAPTPQPWGIDNQAEFLFGIFQDGKSQRTLGSGNIGALPRLWITTPTDSPAQPGELPFVNYYNLA